MFTTKQMQYLFNEHDADEGYWYIYDSIVRTFSHPLSYADREQLTRYVRNRTMARSKLQYKFWLWSKSSSWGFTYHDRMYRFKLGWLVRSFKNADKWKPDLKMVDQLVKMGELFRIHGTPVYDKLVENVNKLESGTWTRPVWSGQWWCLETSHQTHVSEKDPTLLAYTQSMDKLMRGIQTQIRPGRYLQQFYGDVLTPEQIKYWAERQVTSGLSAYDMHVLNNNDPQWAGNKHKLKNLWRAMYARCLVDYSCMRGETAPRVYGLPGNGLGLVTWTRRGEGDPFVDDSVQPYGRAIVRFDRDKPEFNRVFPFAGEDSSMHESALQSWLEGAGYAHTKTLEGIRIDREDSDHGPLCPYIDGYAQRVDVYDKYLLITESGEYDACNTSGHLDFGRPCDECGDTGFGDDDLTWIEGEDIAVCQHCLDRNFVWARGHRSNEMWVREGDAIYCESDEKYYTKAGADWHDVREAEAGSNAGNYYWMDDLVSTSRGLMHMDDADELDEEDSDGNTYAHTNDTTETEDGRTIHTDSAVTTEDGRTIHTDSAVTTEDGRTYHVDDDGLLWFDGLCIHGDDFDPTEFVVVVDTLFYAPCEIPERGAMSLIEYVQYGGGPAVLDRNIITAVNGYLLDNDEPMRLAA